MGLGSGVIYAVVVLLLRALRNDSSAWLIALNLLGSALTIGLLIWATSGSTLFMSWMLAPSARQLVTLLLLGAIQMAMPYWLFARGLRVVSSQEAAMITLIEPLLNPLWAYWLTPAKDTPTGSMISGGLLILAGLIWRYRPGLGNVSQPVDREGQGRAAVGKHSAP
jgi:drug/metabolite transporter (DMT)-like permease